MKAVVFEQYGGPEVLQVRELPIPEPKEGEVLLRMRAAGVAKPDYLMRTGAYPWTKGILPFYPGLYGAGEIAALGAGVTGLAVGQKVFIDHPVVCGCYSEYKTAPATAVTVLPEAIDLELAAVANNHVIAWSFLTTACAPSQGRTLYMKGAAGALGTAIVQLAPKKGLKVIASASTPEKCDYLRRLGADCVFCYRQQDEKQAVLDFTDGQGADYVLDQCAGDGFVGQFDLLNRGGTIVIYNTLNGYPQENLVQVLTDNFARCNSVRAFSFHLHDGRLDEITALRDTVFGMLARGEVKPCIGARFTQAEVQEAHALLDTGTCLGSILLQI